jgi:hypothetical protein
MKVREVTRPLTAILLHAIAAGQFSVFATSEKNV